MEKWMWMRRMKNKLLAVETLQVKKEGNHECEWEGRKETANSRNITD